MDLNDAERYAAAALFTLALHSTHVETGVDRNGNALAESDIAWGCPSEELFDEYLLSEVPLRLPAELQDIFWGFDCMAPAGLAPRLYAWLKIPRKAWPGLLRMPDLAGSAGSAAAVAAFVALVRRYAAFLDPELAFTTGQVSRLQQHFTQPDYAAMDVAAAPQQQPQQQRQPVRSSSEPALTALQDDAKATRTRESSSSSGGGGGGGEAECGEKLDSSSSRMSKPIDRCSGNSIKSLDDEWQRIVETATAGKAASTVDAVAAAAAHITAAAVAASRESSQTGVPPTISSSSSDLATSPQQQQQQQQHVEQPVPAAVGAEQTDMHDSTLTAATPPVNSHTSFAAADFHELHAAVDQLPKAADEGTVVPAATFTPAEQYTHTTSHKAVLAVFEIIGGCLCSNTQPFMEPLFAVATKEAQGAAAAAAASKAKDNSSSSSCDKAAAAAWFAAGATDESADKSKSSSSPKEAAAAAAAANKASAQEQPLQGLAAAQWYDARARVAVKRIAHWLRVPWPQVRAFEQMWAAQALSVDPNAQPKYSSSSRAMQYLKVGAAAVGGGALLAVTGGLAAPAIAAGLGAAVSLAHGGAAAAAAVAGFAGSSAGTAAVTGLFGAWGASVGGGSAGRLYGEVQEFGFLDIGQSIYTDGRPLAGYEDGEQAAECETAAAAAASSSDSADAQAAATVAENQKSNATNDSREQQDGSQPIQQQQGGGFFARLFSSGAAGSSDGGSSSAVDTQQALHGNSNSQGVVNPDAVKSGYQPIIVQGDGSRSSSDPGEQQQQEAAAGRVLQALGSFSDIASDKPNTAAAQETVAAAAVERKSLSSITEQHQQQRSGSANKLQRQSTSEHPLQDEWEPDWAPAAQQQQQQQQQQQHIETNKQRQAGTSSSKKSPASSSKDIGNDSTSLISSAAASAAKPPPPQHPAAAAAAGSSAAGASSGLSTWFTRKAAPPPAAAAPVYVPLLPTPINPRHSADTRMALLIAVNGCCISCTEDYVRPWLGLPSRDCDRFALVWESQCLKELGGALVSFLAQQALTQVTQKTIQTFLYTGLVGALALPMTLTTALKVAFGSKWLVALRRAQAAGKMLAMQLVQCCHGGRPVTLIGCSMGSRLVFHCLLELSRLGLKGCVENVILLGAPLSCRPDRWCSVRSVVAGRLINGYSVNDWTLGLLYRVHSSNSLWLQAAGIGKVEVPGVENVNLSRLVSGHSDYLTAMDDILDVINLQDT